MFEFDGKVKDRKESDLCIKAVGRCIWFTCLFYANASTEISIVVQDVKYVNSNI